MADQLRVIVGVFGIQRDADARRGMYRMPGQVERPVEGHPDLLGDHFGALRRGNAIEQHQEFVATDAAEGVRFAHALSEAMGDFLQEEVTDLMSKYVVYLLGGGGVGGGRGGRGPE